MRLFAARQHDLTLVDRILDTSHPPVGKFRLLSTGFKGSMLPAAGGAAVDSRACLTCGNCVDACPVVAAYGGPLPMRTSMSLETLVGDQCLRCYRCVQVCPQVDADMKAYAREYRFPTVLAHLLLAVTVPLLGLTGITIYHWGPYLPADLYALLGWAHRLLALVFLATPILLYGLDRRRLTDSCRRALAWGRADAQWLRSAWRWVAAGFRGPRPRTGYFTTGQKAWFLYVLLILPVFAATGAIMWLSPAYRPGDPLNPVTGLHVLAALITDTLVAVHLASKIAYPALRGWRQSAARRRRVLQPGPVPVWSAGTVPGGRR